MTDDEKFHGRRACMSRLNPFTTRAGHVGFMVILHLEMIPTQKILHLCDQRVKSPTHIHHKRRTERTRFVHTRFNIGHTNTRSLFFIVRFLHDSRQRTRKKRPTQSRPQGYPAINPRGEVKNDRDALLKISRCSLEKKKKSPPTL